jgi:hypothetical protein
MSIGRKQWVIAEVTNLQLKKYGFRFSFEAITPTRYCRAGKAVYHERRLEVQRDASRRDWISPHTQAAPSLFPGVVLHQLGQGKARPAIRD